MHYFVDRMSWLELISYFMASLILISCKYYSEWFVEKDRSSSLKREMLFAYCSIVLIISIGMVTLLFDASRSTTLKFIVSASALILAIYLFLSHKKYFDEVQITKITVCMGGYFLLKTISCCGTINTKQQVLYRACCLFE